MEKTESEATQPDKTLELDSDRSRSDATNLVFPDRFS